MDWRSIQALFWSILLATTNSPCVAQDLKDCTCGDTVTGIGCYNDSNWANVLPILLFTDRDKSSRRYSNKTVDWHNWNQYMNDIVCRCANKTRENNFKIFGIQHYGECWSGNDEEYNKFGQSKRKCITYDYSLCVKPTFEQCCIGKGNGLYIYKVEDPVLPVCYDDLADCPTKAAEGKCQDASVRDDCGLSCQQCYYDCVVTDKPAPDVVDLPDYDGKMVLYLSFQRGAVNRIVRDDSGTGNEGKVDQSVLIIGSTGNPCGRASFLSRGDIHFSGDNFKVKPQYAVTISMRARFSDVTGDQVLFVTKGVAHKCPQYVLKVKDGKITWMHRNERQEIVFECYVESSLESGKWYQIAAVYSSVGGKAAVFVDGVQKETCTGGGELSQDWAEQVSIGDIKAGRPMNGMVDEFRIYNYALSQTEIDSLNNECPD